MTTKNIENFSTVIPNSIVLEFLYTHHHCEPSCELLYAIFSVLEFNVCKLSQLSILYKFFGQQICRACLLLELKYDKKEFKLMKEAVKDRRL